MIYIKRIIDDIVQIGGEVATEQMLEDGWFEYNGDIPSGNNFKLINGVLESYIPEIPELDQIRIYKEYLDNTDHKMYNDYEPKEDENLEYIKTQRSIARSYLREHKRQMV